MSASAARPALRAPFATDPDRSRGRLFPEKDSAHRTPFQRDRDRIIHSSAFRRLKHKTQVFVEHEGDYYRTRLTHSLEVAQVSRTVARTLGLDEDLAEAVALAHDLGHTPFGHTGEEALHAVMEPFGGFDHNAQALKIVTDLERRYAKFDGLNLTWETLEGIAKHNGPLISGPGADVAALPYALAEYVATHDLELHTHAGPEAQVAAISDDVAYNVHDFDDGLRSGLITEADLADLPLIGENFARVAARWPGLEPHRLWHEALRRVFGALVEDMLAETRARIAQADPRSAEEVRALGRPIVAFSDGMAESIRAIRAFLFTRIYRHWTVQRMRRKADAIVRELFEILLNEPGLLPDDWGEAAQGAPTMEGRARIVANYIAGMTDRFALQEHRKLTDPFARA